MTLTASDRKQLVGLVRDFAAAEVAPRVRDYDRDEYLPVDILEKMAALGLFGGTVEEQWGGAGLDHVSFAAVIEEISRVDHCLGVLLSMPSALVGGGIAGFGSEEQKARWLRPLASGEIFGGAGDPNLAVPVPTARMRVGDFSELLRPGLIRTFPLAGLVPAVAAAVRTGGGGVHRPRHLPLRVRRR